MCTVSIYFTHVIIDMDFSSTSNIPILSVNRCQVLHSRCVSLF